MIESLSRLRMFGLRRVLFFKLPSALNIPKGIVNVPGSVLTVDDPL